MGKKKRFKDHEDRGDFIIHWKKSIGIIQAKK